MFCMGNRLHAGFAAIMPQTPADIEGAETEVFRVSPPWLASIRNIAIELHGDAARCRGMPIAGRTCTSRLSSAA